MRIPIFLGEFKDEINIDFRVSPSDIPNYIEIVSAQFNEIQLFYPIAETKVTSLQDDNISLKLGKNSGRIYSVWFSHEIENLNKVKAFVRDAEFPFKNEKSKSNIRIKENFNLSKKLIFESIDSISDLKSK